MKTKYWWRIILIFLVSAMVLFSAWMIPEVIRYRQTVKAAGSFPILAAFNGAVLIPCFTTGSPPVCTGGMLCSLLDVGRCTMYLELSGTPVGPSPPRILISRIVQTQIGLIPGGSYIGGCNSPTFCHVHGSFGGSVFGITKSLSDLWDKILAWVEPVKKWL
ncbi:hypothetical protein D6821_02485 [Candidatus Parcubacteria bacterium]|nr:MAG: hypothetical protein D6821_02485 [Candidatus Parcubacteria bacterium]